MLATKPPYSFFNIRRFISVSVLNRFQQGDRIPSGLKSIHENSPGNKLDLAQALSCGKYVVVGVPAAFSPACSSSHVPGYIRLLPELKSKGVSQVLITTVNDSFVTAAWARSLKCPPDVRIIADTQAEFAKAAGHLFDSTEIFGNKRSKRYAMIVQDGKILQEFIEPDNIGVNVSSAESVLKAL